MFTLQNFYKSKQWQKLLSVIKAERLNDDGNLICEYCGKPIISAYDCIGHHVIHLTDDNVNDYNISLNPDNIQLVHHKCHNIIHNKLGYSKREVFLVYGPPLSGKTTYVNNVSLPGDLIVDMDSIWQCISGLARYQKPARLNAVAFKMRDDLIDAIKYKLGKWQSAYLIGGYPLISERERLCSELGARSVFLDISKEKCLSRLTLSEDRDSEEWTQYINEWFRRFIPDEQPSP